MADIEIDEKLEIDFRKIFTLFLIFNITSIIILNLKTQLIGYVGGGYTVWHFNINELIKTHGIVNVWTPYPQGAQIISYAVYKISYYISIIFSNIFGPIETFAHLPIFHALFLLLIIFIPHILTFVLIYLIGKEFNEKIGLFACLAYAFFWIPYYFAVLTNYVYDPLTMLILVAGIYYLITKKQTYAAILIALGTVIKIFPVLLFLPALKYIKSREDRIKFLFLFSSIILIIFIPFILFNKDMFLSPYYWQNGRPPWESWYAIIGYVMDLPFNYSQPYYLGDRSVGWIYWGLQPNLSTLTTPVPKQPTQWWNLLSLAGIAVSFLPVVLTRIENKKQLIDWSLYILTAFMFWNIGWSPQYVMYLLPLIIFLFIDRLQDGIYLAMFLQILVALGYPVLLPLAMRGDFIFIIWYSFVVLARYAVFIYIMAVIIKRYSGGYAVGNIWR